MINVTALGVSDLFIPLLLIDLGGILLGVSDLFIYSIIPDFFILVRTGTSNIYFFIDFKIFIIYNTM